MFISHFINMLLSVIFSTAEVIFITLPVLMIGVGFSRLIKCTFNTPSIHLAYGLFIITIISSYISIFTYFSLAYIFIFFALCGYILLAKEIYYGFHAKMANIVYLKSFFITLFCASVLFFSANLIILSTWTVGPSIITNNDIFVISFDANMLLHKANYSHILLGTADPLSLKYTLYPAFGTAATIIMAMISVLINLHGNVLEIIAIAIVAFSAWINFVIMDLIVEWFGLNRFLAFIISCTVILGQFFTFIVYAGFMAETLEIFCLLMILLVGSKLYLHKEFPSLIKTCITFSPVIALSIMSYHSFYPSLFMGMVFLYILLSSRMCNIKEFWRLSKKFFTSILTAMLLSFIICAPSIPLFLLYFKYELPLIGFGGLRFLSTSILFSLPIFKKMPMGFSHSYPPFAWASYDGINLISSILFLILILYLIKKVQFENLKLVYRIWGCLVTAFLAYTLAYFFAGPVYHSFKLASYIILPLSFIPIAVLAKWIVLVFSKRAQKIILCFIILLIFGCSYTIKTLSVPIAPIINDFKKINISSIEHQSKIKYLILDTDSFAETLAAFNWFSQDYLLLPKYPSYVSEYTGPLPVDLTPNNTAIITTQPCNISDSHCDKDLKHHLVLKPFQINKSTNEF